jgi:hypothetical protein
MPAAMVNGSGDKRKKNFAVRILPGMCEVFNFHLWFNHLQSNLKMQP